MTNEDPIFVDLDGTLIRSDVLIESLFLLIKKKFLYLFLLPVWLIKGFGYFKRQVALQVRPDPALLPYNQQFLNYLKEAHQQGRRLILVTAADRLIAEEVAKHLGIFDGIIATDCGPNLAGKNKLLAIQAQYPNMKIVYAGDSGPDLKVWKNSDGAIYVGNSKRLRKKIEASTKIVYQCKSFNPSACTILKALRMRSWIKNLLVFIPVLVTYQYDSIFTVLQAFSAFIAFSLFASAGYVFNDMIDLEEDRLNPQKNKRAFACGDLSIKHWAQSILWLVVAGTIIALITLPHEVTALLYVYLLVAFSYTLFIRKFLFSDLIALTIMYMFRIVTGCYATTITLSEWWLLISVFLFLSFALMKRVIDLRSMEPVINYKNYTHGYEIEDSGILMNFGMICSYIAILFYSLYINSSQSFSWHSNPDFLWFATPFLLYWFGRVWILVRRGTITDDPLAFSLKDVPSYVVLFAVTIIFLMAR